MPKEDTGESSFEEFQSLFERFLNLNSDDWMAHSNPRIQQVGKETLHVKRLLKQLQPNFRIGFLGEVFGEELITEVRRTLGNFGDGSLTQKPTEHLIAIQNSLRNLQASIRKLLRRFDPESLANDTRTELQIEAEAQLKRIQDIAGDYEDRLRNLQEHQAQLAPQIKELERRLADATVMHEAGLFENAAKNHQNWFLGWLVLGISAFVFMVVWAHSLFFSDAWICQPEGNAGHVLKQAIPRIAALLIGFAVVAWLLRAAASERHNVIVNRHRQHALWSFQTFVSTTTSSQVREAILLRACSAIYTPQPTGFFRDEKGGAESASIVEMIRESQPKEIR